MFGELGFFEATVLGLMTGAIWVLYAASTNLRNMHQEQMHEAERHRVYLRYITQHVRNADPELSLKSKERFRHELSADLKCVGLDSDAACEIYEKSAQEWNKLQEDSE